MSATHDTDDDLYRARLNLTLYIRQRAEDTETELGFGWIGTDPAPSTYQQLRGAFDRSQATGAALPVSNLYCDDTIYLTPDDNVRFRFFHDAHHVRLGVSFDLADEWELALWHLADLERAGYGPTTLEYRLLQADTVGQNVVLGVAGRFPLNQREFVETCAEIGLAAGVLHEIRRLP